MTFQVARNLLLRGNGFEEIDVLGWQLGVNGMLSVANLELALAVVDGYLRNKVLPGQLVPDQTLETGARRKVRKSQIAEQFGLKPITAANIRERFLAFCADQQRLRDVSREALARYFQTL